MVSHCRTYSAREDYVDTLKKFTNVEVFGNCNNKRYNSDTDTLLGKALFTQDILTHNIAIKRYCNKNIEPLISIDQGKDLR